MVLIIANATTYIYEHSIDNITATWTAVKNANPVLVIANVAHRAISIGLFMFYDSLPQLTASLRSCAYY